MNNNNNNNVFILVCRTIFHLLKKHKTSLLLTRNGNPRGNLSYVPWYLDTNLVSKNRNETCKVLLLVTPGSYELQAIQHFLCISQNVFGEYDKCFSIDPAHLLIQFTLRMFRSHFTFAVAWLTFQYNGSPVLHCTFNACQYFKLLVIKILF